MGKQYRAFGAGLVADQAQLSPIRRFEKMDLRRPNAQSSFLPRRLEAIRGAERRKNTTVGVEQNGREKGAESAKRAQALLGAGSVGRTHGGKLAQEIGAVNRHHPLPQNRLRWAASANRDIQSCGVAPHIQNPVITNRFPSLQPVLVPFLAGQPHAIDHVSSFDRIDTLRKQAECAVSHGQRLFRKRRRLYHAAYSCFVTGIVDQRLHVFGGDGDDEPDRAPLRFSDFGTVLKIILHLQAEMAGHAFGKFNAHGRASRLLPREGWKRVIDRPAVVRGNQCRLALGEPADGQQRIDSERARNDRTIANIEAAMHCVFLTRIENLAFVVHDTVFYIIGHDAAAQWVDGDQLVMQKLAPNWIAQIGAADRPGGLFEPAVHLFENGLLADSIPPNAEPVIFEIHLTRAVVMSHN